MAELKTDNLIFIFRDNVDKLMIDKLKIFDI